MIWILNRGMEIYMNFQALWLKFGDSITSLGIKVLLAFLTLVIGLKLIGWVRKITKRCLQRANADLGLIQFLDAFIKFSLIGVLVLGIATSFGVQVASITAILGSAGVTLGLALQGSLSNFAGGVLILLLKPFKVGDYIIEDTNKNEGTVTEISLFYTKLSTFDEKVVVLPNGNLANTSLTNVTEADTRRLDLKISVSYDSDLKAVKMILQEILNSEEGVLKDRETTIFVDDFGDSGIIMGVRCYTKQPDFWQTKWRILEKIKEEFDENKIEIPYNKLDVYMK